MAHEQHGISKPLATRLFVHQQVQATIKEHIKSLHYWSFGRGNHQSPDYLQTLFSIALFTPTIKLNPSNFTAIFYIFSWGSNWQWISIGLSNELIPSGKLQAISRTNVFDQFLWQHMASPWTTVLTHWGWYEIAAILQTTFWNGFSWMTMYWLRLKFHWTCWSLFPRAQLTIFQHWFG